MVSSEVRLSTSTPGITDGWQRMLALTGHGIPATRTGWDRLVQAIFDTPSARFRNERRIEAIYVLYCALCHVGDDVFTVLVLRFGLTVDDRESPEYSRHEISQHLALSQSRVGQLERAGLAYLRTQFGDPATRFRACFHYPT